LEFNIWKNDNKRREILWKNKIMQNVFECFNKFQELGFEDRIGQQDMSFDIIDAIADGQNIIVEASVGIGKSYAYLIPLMYYHKLTKKPFIISTSTITLQEQIEKDIQQLSEWLDIPINIVIAKGKCNYLCRDNLCSIKSREIKKKFSNLRNNPFLNDRANVNDISDTEWNKICVNKCNFNHCSYYSNCYFIKKREEMRTTMGAIICNHDLLIENQKRITDEKNILLSSSEVIVIDEAHSLEEKTRNSYKKTFSIHQINENLRKSVKLLRKHRISI